MSVKAAEVSRRFQTIPYQPGATLSRVGGASKASAFCPSFSQNAFWAQLAGAFFSPDLHGRLYALSRWRALKGDPMK
jgi:hypothetical protein